jgi:VIT1/CCC1 family predicted Fe2+/Mn2+ transporter
MPAAKRNLLIGGVILLAVPFVAGMMRKSFVQFPREVWVALVLLAAIGAVIGIYVMTRPADRGH